MFNSFTSNSSLITSSYKILPLPVMTLELLNTLGTNGLGPRVNLRPYSCLSDSGQYVYISTAENSSDYFGQIYYSSNYGATFTKATIPTLTAQIYRVRCSLEGQVVGFSTYNNKLYLSGDFGNNFSVVPNATGNVIEFDVQGTVVAYCKNGNTGSYSYNSGVSFTDIALTNISSVHCCSNGTICFGQQSVSPSTPVCTVSIAYGFFTPHYSTFANHYNRHCTISDNGQYIMLQGVSSTNFMTSIDSGSTFQSKTIFGASSTNGNENGICQSNNGKISIITSLDTNNDVYLSFNYGVDYVRINTIFTSSLLSVAYWGINSSSDAKHVILTSTYTSQILKITIPDYLLI